MKNREKNEDVQVGLFHDIEGEELILIFPNEELRRFKMNESDMLYVESLEKDSLIVVPVNVKTGELFVNISEKNMWKWLDEI